MGRPSLAPQRRRQVLSAFARCVARSGIAATSLEDVAREAGLARGHVRHFLGNRHDQVVALCEWVSSADQDDFAKVHQATDDDARVQAVMEYLFEPSFYTPSDDLTVFLALFEEARRDEVLRGMLLKGYDDVLDTMTAALSAARPGLPAVDAQDVAYLMLCAAVGNAHLSQTGMSLVRADRLGSLCRRVLGLLTPRPGTSAARAPATAPAPRAEAAGSTSTTRP